MTKRRLPLTFENALTKVASHIGWEEVARICGRAVNAVRNWSDPDTSATITLEAALKLDVAYHAAGGDGAPFLHCYAARMDLERLAAVPGREALLHSVAVAAKESGEAAHATLKAAHPAAQPADFIVAEREIEELIVAATHQLSVLRARRASVEAGHEYEEPKLEQRVPAVTPPNTS